MPTKADVKRLSKPIKIKIRKGDQVMIISGKDKGEIGTVYAVSPKEQKAIVYRPNDENPDAPTFLNAAIKHRKAKFQGQKSARVRIPVPIHLSNLMVLDPKTGSPTRLGRRKEDGKTVRYAKKSGETVKDAPTMEKE
jgi:large subunit ribosomal protein L24